MDIHTEPTYVPSTRHAGGVLYGMELGSVTLKRIGFFCFPIKHSTHTQMAHTPTGKPELVSVVCENLYISLDTYTTLVLLHLATFSSFCLPPPLGTLVIPE